MRFPLFLSAILLLVVASQLSAAAIPSDAELTKLTRESLLRFNEAVRTGNFTAFHKQISVVWQKQITPDELLSVFRNFVEQKLDLGGVAEAEPTFSPAPSIDDDGVLTVTGSYPTAQRLDFRLKYYKEKGQWKLLGVKLDLKPTGATDVKLPSEAEVRALVRKTLVAFNRAVQEKSFAEFYDGIADVWQKQTTPEQLEQQFQSFIDQEIDIGAVTKLTPKYDKEPALDLDGVLSVEGHYETRPSIVRFRLAFIFEDPEWRLVKINVKVSAADDSPSDESDSR